MVMLKGFFVGSLLAVVGLCLQYTSEAQGLVSCQVVDTGTSRNPGSAKMKVIFGEPVKGLLSRHFTITNGAVNELSGSAGEDSPSTSYAFNLDAKFPTGSNEVDVSITISTGTLQSSSKTLIDSCGTFRTTLKRTTSVGVSSPVPTATTSTVATRTPTPRATPTATVVGSTPTPGKTATPTIKVTSSATPLPTPTRTATPTPKVTIVTPAPTSTSGPIAGCTGSVLTGGSLQPIFPGAEGFGTTTVAGSGRNFAPACNKIYPVRNLNDSGPGSLRECAEGTGPRTCVFEVSGLIWSTREMKVTQPFLTIAGQTAPSPGIAVRGSGISIQASDVLVQHIRVRVGDDPRDPCCKAGTCSAAAAQFCTADPGSRDGIRVLAATGAISNVVLDHVSVSWALDEGVSWVPDKGDVSNVTFSNSIIGAGLDMSIHPEASIPTDPGHSKGVLINGAKAVRNLSFQRNLLAHNADRNIRISTPIIMEYINNVVYGWGRGRGAGRTIELTNSSLAEHKIDLIGNTYIPSPDTFCPGTTYRPELCFEKNDGTDDPVERSKMHYLLRVGNGVSSGLSANSRYFLRDNFGPTRTDGTQDEWAAADQTFFTAGRAGLIYPQNKSSARVASSGTVTEVPSGMAYEQVLSAAGARPADRDSVDLNLVADVVNRTGRIVNCVFPDGSARCEKNAGGWPSYPLNSRPLVIPENPSGDDNRDGYTNLENWLFEFSRGVEGR